MLTGALGSLDVDERETVRLDGVEIDRALVVRDVNPLRVRAFLRGRRGGGNGDRASKECCSEELHS